ncbi:hypothetical protein J6590_019283 [Homalodisca vitripennis]|nr:hypothetical protein J6590_019283 [Homalodisca vitripennis]
MPLTTGVPSTLTPQLPNTAAGYALSNVFFRYICKSVQGTVGVPSYHMQLGRGSIKPQGTRYRRLLRYVVIGPLGTITRSRKSEQCPKTDALKIRESKVLRRSRCAEDEGSTAARSCKNLRITGEFHAVQRLATFSSP